MGDNSEVSEVRDNRIDNEEVPASAEEAKEEHDEDDGSFARKIKALYIDPHFPGSGQGITSFYRHLKEAHEDGGRSLEQIRAILILHPAYVTQIPSRVHFPRRHVDKLGPGLQAQMDLGIY